MHAVSCNFDEMNSSTLSQGPFYILFPGYLSWTTEFFSLKQIFIQSFPSESSLVPSLAILTLNIFKCKCLCLSCVCRGWAWGGCTLCLCVGGGQSRTCLFLFFHYGSNAARTLVGKLTCELSHSPNPNFLLGMKDLSQKAVSQSHLQLEFLDALAPYYCNSYHFPNFQCVLHIHDHQSSL